MSYIMPANSRWDLIQVLKGNLVLDYIIKKLDIRKNVSTKMAHIDAFADAVIIISGNLKALEGALHELVNTAQEIGLIISQEKIEIYKSNFFMKTPTRCSYTC